jgi:phospholipase/carboxylesterase
MTMMVKNKAIAGLMALSLAVALPAGAAHAAGPALTALPPATPLTASDTRSGVLQLAGGAYAYLPKGRTGAPAPVLVALHGAGGQAGQTLESFREAADANGIVLLIPQSAKGTWDMIEDLKSRLGVELNVQPRYGKDLKAIDTALADLFTKVAVDPARVGIMGFSDGATYALSVGTANPLLFKRIIAFSPGPAFLGRSAPDQFVFISHGENDKVLPFATARGHASKLRVKKVPVEFERFDGGHEVPKDIKARAMAFFRDPAAATAATGSSPGNPKAN